MNLEELQAGRCIAHVDLDGMLHFFTIGFANLDVNCYRRTVGTN